MTTCAEQITWTSNSNELKRYLGLEKIDATLQARLEKWLLAAAVKADNYLQRDFVITRARWVVGSTVDAGYVYTLTVTPEDESTYTAYSASYTASAGDSAQKVAYELRKALAVAVASRAVNVGGAGAAVEASMMDPTVALEASNTATGDNATITESLFYDGVPPGVVTGCYEFVKSVYQTFNRQAGLKSQRLGQAAESYDDGGALKHGFKVAVEWWADFKLDVLGGGL